MRKIRIRLPDSLHHMAKTLASQDNASVNQFIASAVAEKVSALETESYLRERAERASAAASQVALAAIPTQEPEDFDRV